MNTATLTLTPSDRIGHLERRLFGSFVEHLGRCVYDGIYEPEHPTADEAGFRRDVAALVRELGVETIRYPGGNFVSGYRWEDGVGLRTERPRRLDLAWHSLETNEVGLDEFAAFCATQNVELMLAVNLGTRDLTNALDLLEYTNVPGGTELSERRRANGVESPWSVRMWCLGNEMDGPWQLGHCSADEYGRRAAATARAMRQLDPDLELVACGSSHRRMPTFGSWEREVLAHCWGEIDFISCHAYYEERDGDRASFLASASDLDKFIDTVSSIIVEFEHARPSDRQVSISVDEWNVWYQERDREIDSIAGIDNWPQAPRLLENVYSVTDAVVVGSLLISLINHADRVKAACQAQLVNVIAPILTEPGGPAWRQTAFYPFAISSRIARGDALTVEVESAQIDSAVHGSVNEIAAAATFDETTGAIAVLTVNRSCEAPVTVTIDLRKFAAVALEEAWLLWDEDPDAANTLQQPERVTVKPLATRLENGILSCELPPIAWAAVALNSAAEP